VAQEITLKPEGTVDVPLSQLRNVSNKIDGLAELELLLKNEAIADCGHGLMETRVGLLVGFGNFGLLLHSLRVESLYNCV
jgi:hypothetical protein